MKYVYEFNQHVIKEFDEDILNGDEVVSNKAYAARCSLSTPVYGYMSFDADMNCNNTYNDGHFELGKKYYYIPNDMGFKGYFFSSSVSKALCSCIDSKIFVIKATNLTVPDIYNFYADCVTNTIELVKEIEISKIDRIKYNILSTIERYI